MSFDATPDLRASDADREVAVERLRVAAQDGRLDAEELEQRVQDAYAARTHADLTRLTADVTPPPPVPVPPPAPRRPRQTNTLAVASLVSGVLWFGWVGSLLAIVFGHVALSQIKSSDGEEDGQAMAIAGLVLGYGALLVFLLFFLLVFGA